MLVLLLLLVVDMLGLLAAVEGGDGSGETVDMTEDAVEPVADDDDDDEEEGELSPLLW